MEKNIGRLEGKVTNRRRDCPGLASGSTNMMLCVHILSISLPLGHFWTTTMVTAMMLAKVVRDKRKLKGAGGSEIHTGKIHCD